ncbi:MAG: hypothetical protein ACOYS2_01735 [Patescibacteria group bacterium]
MPKTGFSAIIKGQKINRKIAKMTLRSYIWGIRIINLISLCALSLVIYFVDPEKAGFFGLVAFYCALFFFLAGFLNLMLLWIRRLGLGSEAALSSLRLSFRQGILLAILFIGLLILQSFRALFWWDALLLAGAIFLVEMYFLSKER